MEKSSNYNHLPYVFEVVSQGRQTYSEPDLQFTVAPEFRQQLGEHPWYFRPSLFVELNGFDLNQRMADLQGPKLEVGGPTYQYHVLGEVEMPSDLIVTNYTHLMHGEPGYVELPQVDAAELPYADGSLGALFSSALPKRDWTNAGNEFNLRHAFMLEAKRCLEPGGILVGQRGDKEDIQYAMDLGFTPVRVLESEGSYPLTGPFSQWDYVMVNTPAVPGLEYTYEAIGNVPPAQLAEGVGVVAVQAAVSPPASGRD